MLQPWGNISLGLVKQIQMADALELMPHNHGTSSFLAVAYVHFLLL
jgi:hypothetical protein